MEDGCAIVAIYISPGHNFFGRHGMDPGTHRILSVASVECVAGKGLVGDRFFGFKEDYKGQITFFAWEVYDELCKRFGVTDKDATVFRRNVITRGLDLNSLIGKKFQIQGIEFEGIAECSPCHWMNDAFFPGTEGALRKRGGLRAKILTDGVLKVS